LVFRSPKSSLSAQTYAIRLVTGPLTLPWGINFSKFLNRTLKLKYQKESIPSLLVIIVKIIISLKDTLILEG
jgi:hypothetical protein